MRGRLAQLGERLVYTQEVTGSNPVPPTELGVASVTAPALERFGEFVDDASGMWRNSIVALAIGLALRATGVYDAYGWKWTWLLLVVTGVVTLPWALWRERRER